MKIQKRPAASSNSQVAIDRRSNSIGRTLFGSRRGICIIHRQVSQRVCVRAWLNLSGEERRGNLLYCLSQSSFCREPPNDFLSSRGRGIFYREIENQVLLPELLGLFTFHNTGKRENSVVVALRTTVYPSDRNKNLFTVCN